MTCTVSGGALNCTQFNPKSPVVLAVDNCYWMVNAPLNPHSISSICCGRVQQIHNKSKQWSLAVKLWFVAGFPCCCCCCCCCSYCFSLCFTGVYVTPRRPVYRSSRLEHSTWHWNDIEWPWTSSDYCAALQCLLPVRDFCVFLFSGVARIWSKGDTKLRENNIGSKGDTQKYCEIRAINSDKVIDLYFLLNRQPHGVECQSLCGSEVTWKIKQLEVEGYVPNTP